MGIEPTLMALERCKLNFLQRLLLNDHTRKLVELELQDLPNFQERARNLSPMEEFKSLLSLPRYCTLVELKRKLNERLEAIELAWKNERCDGVVDSIRTCIQSQNTTLLRLFTNAIVYEEFNSIEDED
jgi:hypothetical protein